MVYYNYLMNLSKNTQNQITEIETKITENDKKLYFLYHQNFYDFHVNKSTFVYHDIELSYLIWNTHGT